VSLCFGEMVSTEGSSHLDIPMFHLISYRLYVELDTCELVPSVAGSIH
jgi:hypothetical protein